MSCYQEDFISKYLIENYSFKPDSLFKSWQSFMGKHGSKQTEGKHSPKSQLKKQIIRQCALFCLLGRCMNTQIEILKHPSPTREVNVLCSYNKGRAEKTAVSSEAHQQKCARLLTSPLLFLKTLAKLSNPPIHSHFEISVFYYFICITFSAGSLEE